VETARIKSSSGKRELVFSDAQWAREELGGYSAGVQTEAMTASTLVYAYGPTPLALFEVIANEWRGWHGSKEWSSLEGELSLSATHDGVGTITLQVRLAHLGFDAWDWEARAALALDAGAQLQTTVTALRSFFSS
jgi:Family of unknown function (DUF6228)